MKRRIGDFEVFPIGLGGMPMSIARRPDEDQSIRTIHAALDAGMTFIDTANVYCLDDDDIGHNERLIKKAIASWSGERPVVATKGGLARPRGAWTRSAHPDALRRACEQSLEALGVEVIDIYQLHAPDPEIPYEDQIGLLADLKAEGKIRHAALSNVGVEEIQRASAMVEIVSVQNRCNPFDRRAFDEGVVDHCAKAGITFLPYSPVGGSRGTHQVKEDATLVEIGGRHERSPFEVALAWMLTKIPHGIPIPGASKEKNARSSASAASLELTPADLFQLEAAFPV